MGGDLKRAPAEGAVAADPRDARSGRRKSRSRTGRQGWLDASARHTSRCTTSPGRATANRQGRQAAGRGQYRRRAERELHERDRAPYSPRTGRTRASIRTSAPSTKCAYSNPHAALDDLRREGTGCPVAGRRAGLDQERAYTSPIWYAPVNHDRPQPRPRHDRDQGEGLADRRPPDGGDLRRRRARSDTAMPRLKRKPLRLAAIAAIAIASPRHILPKRSCTGATRTSTPATRSTCTCSAPSTRRRTRPIASRAACPW